MDLITYTLLKKYIDDNKIDVSAIVNDFTTGGLDKVASAETVKTLIEVLGQYNTDLELNLIEQGQYITELEIKVLSLEGK